MWLIDINEVLAAKSLYYDLSIQAENSLVNRRFEYQIWTAVG